jgi:hypothetical protein
VTESDPSAGGNDRSGLLVVIALIASAIAFFVASVALMPVGGYDLVGGVLLAVALGDALCALVVSRWASVLRQDTG